jgi:cytochrome c-type biogenesis protein CcmF
VNAALGTAGVAVGLAASILGALTVAYGLWKDRPELRTLASRYALVIAGGVLLAVFAMERALITRDFTVQYVADNGSSRTPALFNIATLWAALEGSILLWALVLAGYLLLVVWKFRDRLADPLVGWALLTMLVVCAFFFFLMAGPADPFQTFDPPAGYDGPGPNPLLQNHLLMAFHPPMLYLGYVGFTVPFAFAIAALATGRVGEGWLVETRRWTLFAWGFLTIGVVLGAWWSYEVLGWGGYWAWDPVENASFLPWLTGTAYIHSVMVQERRGMLRVWNLSLLCATFSLTILGTFLTRSGVLDSVHAFSESDIGPMLLGFFGLTVLVSVGLIGWRGDRLRAPGRIDSPISREGAFLANNVLFAAFAFIVLLGTVFPLIVESINGERISVGTPYFNRMTTPIGLALLFLMAIAPALPWRKASAELLRDRLFWPAWAGVATLVVAVALGATGLVPILTFGLAGFAGGAAVRQIVLATRRQGWRGFVGRANGGMVVHLGVVVVAVAIAASGSYASQGEFRLAPGDTATVAGHEVEYLGLDVVESAEKTETQARVRIDGGDVYAPALSQFEFGGQSVGTPSVQSGVTGDVYLSLIALPEGGTSGEAADGEIVLRVIIEPLAVWLWIGGGVIAIGTVLAAFPGRRRKGTDPVSAPVPERLDHKRRGSGEDETGPVAGPPGGGAPDDGDDREPVPVGSSDGGGS